MALSGVAGASAAGALVGVDAALLGVNVALAHHLVWLDASVEDACDPGVDVGWKSFTGMTQLIAGSQGG